jgi:tetratricopeptide (TPR) repeat protein
MSMSEPIFHDESPPELPGRIGRYRLIRRLGSGGFGDVYLGEDERLERMVAVKVLRGAGPGAAGLLERFRREARLLAHVRHPGLCDVYETGIDGGIPFLVMRYVEGRSLAAALAARRSAQDAEATLRLDGGRTRSVRTEPDAIRPHVHLIEKVARALHVAHEAGVIHRDVKPGNILVGPDEEPVVVDFGLAREIEGDDGLTRTGELLGTPAYMAPEQLRAGQGPVDRRVDVWALGVTLFECLTLRRPFEGPTREAVHAAILGDPTPDPRRIDARIPTDLAVILATALEKDLGRRYATAEALAEDLVAFRENRPIAARPLGRLERLRRWSLREPALAASLCMLALALPAVAVLVTLHVQAGPVRAEATLRRDRARQEDLVALALVAVAEERHGDARRILEEACAVRPGFADATGFRILLALREGALDEAERLLEEDPGLLEGTATLALLKGWLAEARGAAGAVDRALQVGPLSSLDHWMRAEVESTRRDLEAALRSATQAVLLAERPRLFLHHARAFIAARQGRGDVVEESVAVLRARWPAEPMAHLSAGVAWQHLGRASEAESAYRRALDLRPGDPEILWNLGNVLTRAGRYPEAIAAYEDVLQSDPGHARAWRNLGIARERSGQRALAREAYARAVDLDPDDERAFQLYFQACAGAGDVQVVRDWLLQDLSRRPRSRAAPHFAAMLALLEGRYADAIPLFEDLLRSRPDSPSLHGNLAIALARTGRPSDALPHAEAARRLDPGSAEAAVNLGLVLADLGRPADAEALYVEALGMDPGCVEAVVNLSKILIGDGRAGEAVRRLEDALAAGARRAELQLQLGLARSQLGDIEGARAAYEEGLRLDPGSVRLQGNLGFLAYGLNDLDTAERHFREALGLDEGYAHARYGLGQVLRRRGRYAEAEGELRAAEESGRTTRGFARPVARAIDDCRRLAAAAAGEGAEDAARLIDRAEVALAAGETALAVAASAAAFDLSPAALEVTDLYGGPLYRAILAALRAWCEEPARPEALERLLGWMEVEADRVAALARDRDPDRAARQAAPYLHGPDFAPLWAAAIRPGADPRIAALRRRLLGGGE